MDEESATPLTDLLDVLFDPVHIALWGFPCPHCLEGTEHITAEVLGLRSHLREIHFTVTEDQLDTLDDDTYQALMGEPRPDAQVTALIGTDRSSPVTTGRS